jgi:hypothetical protein
MQANGSFILEPFVEARANPQDGLPVNLADARLADFQHLADFLRFSSSS